MDKPSSSRPPQKSTVGRRVRLIPSTPRPGGATPPPVQPGPPNMGIPQPPETFGGNLYSNIIWEAMGRLNREEMEIEGEEENSTESSSEGTNSAASQSSTTSLSSLRFSDGRTFDEIANEVIQRMQEDEREEVSGETQELREPDEILAEEENRAPQEDPVREILDITGTEMLKAQREQLNQLFRIVERMVSYREEGTQDSRRPLPANPIASQNEPSRHNA